MDELTTALDNWSDDADLFPAVRMAARRGRKVLDKYYSLTDSSKMFRLSMSTFSLSTGHVLLH